jgi:lysophospholipase L1-like esterase
MISSVLLLLIEGVLWAAGVEAPGSPVSLSRGFDPAATYFVRDSEVAGGWRTQFMAESDGEHVIPPKGDRKRVLLVGGSNTQSFPRAHLQGQLNARAGADEYEVINLGRNGYGSERVRVLCVQALARLEADILVVYSGHNEFVERGFRMDLEDIWSEGWMKNIAERVQGTRTGGLLIEVFEKEPLPSSAPMPPEAWTWEYAKFNDLTYEDTQLYFDAYAQNLRAICDAGEARGVQVILCTPVHNRFAAPFRSNLRAGADEATRETIAALLAKARENMPPHIRRLVPIDENMRIHRKEWTARQAPPRERFFDPATGRRECLPPLAARDPLLPPSDQWHRVILRFYEALGALHERAASPEELTQLAVAQSTLMEVLRHSPDHPDAHFQLGLVTYALGGDDERVRALLEDAARFDRAPRKANGATNSVVQRLAQEHPAATLFDTDALFASRMPLGLTGWEWMSDHCHLNTGALEVLMEDLAEHLLP